MYRWPLNDFFTFIFLIGFFMGYEDRASEEELVRCGMNCEGLRGNAQTRFNCVIGIMPAACEQCFLTICLYTMVAICRYGQNTNVRNHIGGCGFIDGSTVKCTTALVCTEFFNLVDFAQNLRSPNCTQLSTLISYWPCTCICIGTVRLMHYIYCRVVVKPLCLVPS